MQLLRTTQHTYGRTKPNSKTMHQLGEPQWCSTMLLGTLSTILTTDVQHRMPQMQHQTQRAWTAQNTECHKCNSCTTCKAHMADTLQLQLHQLRQCSKQSLHNTRREKNDQCATRNDTDATLARDAAHMAEPGPKSKTTGLENRHGAAQTR